MKSVILAVFALGLSLTAVEPNEQDQAARLQQIGDELLALGLGRKDNQEQIAPLLAEACAIDPIRGCFLDLVHRSRIASTPAAMSDVIADLRSMCNDQDYAQACAAYAASLRRFNPANAEIRAQALRIDETLCQHEFAPSCAVVASHYLRGEFYERDRNVAVQHFEYACDNGSGIGCFGLASMQRAISQRSDVFEWSSSLLERGCELNHAESCITRFQDLQSGRLGSFDQNEASALLDRACRLGELQVCADR